MLIFETFYELLDRFERRLVAEWQELLGNGSRIELIPAGFRFRLRVRAEGHAVKYEEPTPWAQGRSPVGKGLHGTRD